MAKANATIGFINFIKSIINYNDINYIYIYIYITQQRDI